VFYEGLKWDVQRDMVGKTPDTITELKALMIQLDKERMGANHRKTRSTSNHTNATNSNETTHHSTTHVKAEVAHVGTSLSADDRAQYLREGRCFGCSKTGHRRPDCPDGKPQAYISAIKPTAGAPDATVTPEQSKKLGHPTEPVVPTDKKIWNRASLMNVVPQNTAIVSAITPYHLVRLLTALITLADSIKTTAMVDSGAMGNFIHPRFIETHELVTKPCEPLVVNNMNGRLLSCVDQQAEIQMTIGGHSETLTFDVAPLGKHNIVLGLPWLQQHNPIV
jgi:hypothetical protein